MAMASCASAGKPPLVPLPLPQSIQNANNTSPCTAYSAVVTVQSASVTPPGSPVSPAAMRGHSTDALNTHRVRASFADSPNLRYRPTMEDAVCAHVQANNGVFLGVYDGHGGDSAALHAAASLHSHFERALVETDDDDAQFAFIQAYSLTDAQLRTQRAMTVGATAVTAYLDPTGRTLTVANAGDSRAVLGDSNGDALRLSVDHRPDFAAEKQRVRDAGAFVCGGRVNGCLAVSRALGDHCMKSAVISTPHTVTLPLAPTHEFLILACDGLWDVVDDIQATKLVNALLHDRTSPTAPTPASLAQALVNLALESGTTDNVSVLVALLLHPDRKAT